MRANASTLMVRHEIFSDQMIGRLVKYENGKRYFGKVAIEWIEFSAGELLPEGGASFTVDQVEDIAPREYAGKYEELERGSRKHIDNLNDIINKFLDKCIK